MAKKRRGDAFQSKGKKAKQQGSVENHLADALPGEDKTESELNEKKELAPSSESNVGKSKGDDVITQEKTSATAVTYRRSSRIQNIVVADKANGVLRPVAIKKNHLEVVSSTKEEADNVSEEVKAKVTKVRASNSQSKEKQQLPVFPSSYSAVQMEDPEAAKEVKETLRLFNTYYLRCVQEEQARCQKEESKENAGGKKKAKEESEEKIEESDKKKSRRPDLKAITQMKADNKLRQGSKTLGHVRGIQVGEHFFSRCEMIAVGLHFHWLAGIDYLGSAYKKTMPNWTFPVATSIVLSGCYEDDVDNANDVIYTGQGGNDLLGKKHQIADQVMEKGNLALKNNMEQDLPVRVIRGHKTKNSYTGKVYTYDGLYKVQSYWAEGGVRGFTVYKFKLCRMDGQPVLTTEQVHFVSGQVPSNPSELKGLVCADISNGLERIPVPASNIVDAEPTAPNIRYLATNEVSKNVPEPTPAKGCNCKGGCNDVNKCSCAALNGKKFPYVSLNGGRLVEAMDVVYECGPNCECGPSCSNRVTQKGMRFRLEVFKTANKGWAVRSWDTIPSGAPVCEYTGILMKTVDADNIGTNEYIFDIDCLQTIKGLGDRQRRGVSKESSDPPVDNLHPVEAAEPEYSIDAGTCGNVARFINHSCEPNLFVQCILNEHHDLSRPRVWLCAADTIKPLQELTYDYGYALDSVVKDGKLKVLPCYCGAYNCRKRLH